VAWLLERSADDASAETGCPQCAVGRDALTGWGTLDVLSALRTLTDGTPLPRSDTLEPNDDAGPWARPLAGRRTINATLDYWDDQIDVYSVDLRGRQKLFVRLTPP